MKKFVFVVLSGVLSSVSVYAAQTVPVSKETQVPLVKESKKNILEIADGKEAIAKSFENVIAFQQLSFAINDKQTAEALKKLTEQQKTLSASLYNSGIFKIFTPLDWMQNEAQEGKIFVALIYLQRYPQYATPRTLERIKQIAQNPSPTLKPIVDATLKIHDEYAKKHPYS